MGMPKLINELSAVTVSASSLLAAKEGSVTGQVTVGSLLRLNFVNAKDPAYGATGDGVTDDAAAIQAALATGRCVYLPSGTYKIGTGLVMSTAGQRFIGEGVDAVRIFTSAAIKMLRISALRCQVDGFELDGNGAATNCLVLHNAGQGVTGYIRCDAATSHNILFDTADTTPTGNNNLHKIMFAHTTNSGGCGIAVSTPQLDNNGLEINGIYSAANASHGLLYKGEGLKVYGGIYEGNGGYGIKLSESGDGSNTVGCAIFYPWLEGNTSGGVRGGGKSSSNIAYLDSAQQLLTNESGSEDISLYVQASNGGICTLSDGTSTVQFRPAGRQISTGYVQFPAVQVSSADANALDDYEESTWTPAVTFATPGDLSVAYSSQSGTYTKIGRQVVATFTVTTSTFTHTTASGNLQITGLPFTSATTIPASTLTWQGITKASYTDIAANIAAGSSTMTFVASGSGQAISNVVAADMPTAGTVILRGTVSFIV